MELLTIKVPDIFDAILDNSRLLATTARLADHPHNNAGAPAASVAAALRSTSEYEPELQRQAVQQTWSRTLDCGHVACVPSKAHRRGTCIF